MSFVISVYQWLKPVATTNWADDENNLPWSTLHASGFKRWVSCNGLRSYWKLTCITLVNAASMPGKVLPSQLSKYWEIPQGSHKHPPIICGCVGNLRASPRLWQLPHHTFWADWLYPDTDIWLGYYTQYVLIHRKQGGGSRKVASLP